MGVHDCCGCSLCQTRVNVVPGAGNPHARVVFIGEAPGKNEDVQGVPFVGAAGKNLDGLLGRIGLERDDIYIANILKCRPPKNRDPKPDEMAACTPWLIRQLGAIDPAVLVTMGNFATKFILGTDEGITALRGHVFDEGKYKVLPTFHPAAAIYDRSKMGVLEQDFDLLKTLLEKETA